MASDYELHERVLRAVRGMDTLRRWVTVDRWFRWRNARQYRRRTRLVQDKKV